MDESRKLSVPYCKKVLQRNGKKFTDAQVEKIRDFLSALAGIAYKSYQRKKHEQASSYLYTGIHG